MTDNFQEALGGYCTALGVALAYLSEIAKGGGREAALAQVALAQIEAISPRAVEIMRVGQAEAEARVAHALGARRHH